MDELTAEIGPSDLRRALSWLYDAIERGRIEPVHVGAHLLYRFAGARRSDDELAGSDDAVAG